MKLLKLELKNFKGVKDFTLEPQGKNGTVYGDNGTGKTSLYDAMLWLLFDKNSDFKTAAVKTLDDRGQELHGLEHTVSAEFELYDLKIVSFRKTLTENWVKKRGASEKVYSGDTCSYWVDDVPCKQKEFKARMEEIIPESDFKLLSSPFYFSSVLSWEARRELLFKICGDIPLEEVVGADPALDRLPDLLDGRSIADYKKVLAEKLRETSRELENIPIRIDETSLHLPDLTGLDLKELKKQRAGLNKEIKEITNQIQNIKTDSGKFEIESKIGRLELKLSQVQMRVRAEHQARLDKFSEQIRKLEDDRNRLSATAMQMEVVEKERDDLLKSLQQEKENYLRVKGIEFEFSPDNHCGTCGQLLPADIQADSFNAWKSTELEETTQRGKKLKARFIEVDQKLAELKKGLTFLDEVNADIDKLELAKAELTLPETTEQKELEAEIARLKTEQVALKDKDDSERVVALKEERERLQEQMETVKADIAKFTADSDVKKRVQELLGEEKRLAAVYEELEVQKLLIEKFVRTKVNLIENQIIEKIGVPGVSVKLVVEQKNGGVRECCEIAYNGVPFNQGLNHGHQINIGIAIIGMLSQYLGKTIPLFIDNAEAVTKLENSNSQVIRLVVEAGRSSLIFKQEVKK